MKCSNKLVYLGVTSALSMQVLAGDLNPTSGPTDAGSAMYTLEDIYNRLNGTPASAPSGFTEPTSGPGSTGKTLTEVYNKANDVMNSIPSTPSACTPNSNASPVFTDNKDGTVTDNRTCLIWLKDASCDDLAGTDPSGQANWATALTAASSLANGTCGLTDNSNAGDWRLPTIQELQSLVHYGYHRPAMSNAAGTEKWNTGTAGDDAFSGVQPNYYWSSTAYASGPTSAWYGSLDGGGVNILDKTSTYYVWPVRSRQ
ncbi:MAG: hypothetical protein DRR19_29945 [Candidatus Parabeggiatoa sp. nov. 1]|nr:MAG: hypothetical protein DRR19_29945 [Gammaproteobacteria bacterium]